MRKRVSTLKHQRKEGERQAGRQAGKQTSNQASRQTDRQTDRQTTVSTSGEKLHRCHRVGSIHNILAIMPSSV